MMVAVVSVSLGQKDAACQAVTRRGVPLAVLVSVEQWNALRRTASPTLKDLLLSATGRTDELVPPRTRLSQRPSIRLR